MSEEVLLAKIEQRLDILEDDRKWSRDKVVQLEINNSELLTSRDMLKEQFVRHSNEHKTNYKDLQTEFKGLKGDFSEFKGDVFKKLDTMSGRDSVLKLLFGGIIGAIILAVVKQGLGL